MSNKDISTDVKKVLHGEVLEDIKLSEEQKQRIELAKDFWIRSRAYNNSASHNVTPTPSAIR